MEGMFYLLIVLGVLSLAVIAGMIWLYVALKRAADSLANDNFIIALKLTEVQLPVLSMYQIELQKLYQQALKEEKYENAKEILETLRHNDATLIALKREYEGMSGTGGIGSFTR